MPDSVGGRVPPRAREAFVRRHPRALAHGLKNRCEPRRRVRLPEATMSEGARKTRTFTQLRLRLSAEGRPRSGLTPRRPTRVDEGGGPALRRLVERTTC